MEVIALRQQLAVFKRKRPRPPLRSLDRLFWTLLRRCWSRWAEVLVIVKPSTVVGWHRAGFRLYWRWRSRRCGGRPQITEEIRGLVRRLADENPAWGAPKIHGEPLKLGFVVSERSVARYLRRMSRRRDPGQSWLTFLHNHREVMVAFDFFTVAHGDLPSAVLLFRHRAWTAQNSAFQRYSSSNRGVDRAAIARGISRSRPISLRDLRSGFEIRCRRGGVPEGDGPGVQAERARRHPGKTVSPNVGLEVAGVRSWTM